MQVLPCPCSVQHVDATCRSLVLWRPGRPFAVCTNLRIALSGHMFKADNHCVQGAGNLCCTAALVSGDCFLPRTVLQRPVLGHCTAAHTASLHRCTGIDTSLLVVCFAQQQWSERDAFCQEQCCSALCWVIAQLYEQQIFIGVFALSQAYWQSVLRSSTGQW